MGIVKRKKTNHHRREKAKLKQVQKEKSDMVNAEKQTAKRNTCAAQSKGEGSWRVLERNMSPKDHHSYSIDKNGCRHDNQDM